jgi:hypothetical protein
MGIQHQGGSLRWSPGDYTIVSSSLDNPWFDGTGFNASSVLTDVVGIETDTIPHNMSAEDSCGNQLTVFFHREMGGDMLGNADATAYTAPSGAVVFDAGSRQLEYGLADGSSLTVTGGGLVDPRLQRFFTNMLDDLSTPRAADLSVSLSANPSTSATVKISAVIANSGPDSVRRANVDLALPPGVAFVRVAGKGLRCTRNPVHCAIDQLGPGTKIAAVFTLRIQPSKAAVTARVYASTATDPRPSTALARVMVGRRVRQR